MVEHELRTLFTRLTFDTTPKAMDGGSVYFEPTLLTCDNCLLKFDMGRALWAYEKSWWNLINRYVKPERVALFRQRVTKLIEGTRTGSTSMICREDQKRGPVYNGWGNCLLDLVFIRHSSKGLMLCSTSRTTYVGGRTGYMDAALAINAIEPVVNLANVKFHWTIYFPQISWFKCMEYVWGDPEFNERLRADLPLVEKLPVRNGWRAILMQHRRIVAAFKGKDIKEVIQPKNTMPGPFLRLKRRYLAIFLGDQTYDKAPPSLWTHHLDLEP